MITNLTFLVVVILSVCLGMFIVDWFLSRKLKPSAAVSEATVATALFKGTGYFSSALIVTQIIDPMQALVKLLPVLTPDKSLVAGLVPYYSMFLLLALVSLFLLYWLSLLCWNLFAKGRNIYIEVSNNNVALTVIFCAILLTLSFATRSLMLPVFDGLIPYPEIPAYR